MTKLYNYGKQLLDDDDIQAVVSVLRSDFLTQGPLVLDFENALCKRFGSRYALAVCNGTAALHLAGVSLEWKPGDIILTVPITFLASANCILYSGATPDFVDIHPETYTIDTQKLEQKITDYATNGQKIKAVVAVDFAGNPCDWEQLRFLAHQYDFQLIDDAAHAIGAEHHEQNIGSSSYADITMFSFHPVKHITTGEGGALLTNKKELYDKIKLLRSHGMTKEKKHLERNDGPWYYEMHEVGFNYRITDFQCALGLSQLAKLEEFIKKRRTIAEYYNGVFGKDSRFIIPASSPNSTHSYHLYPLQIDFKSFGVNKKTFFEKMRQHGINLQVHYIPVHLQPFYKKQFGFREGDFPVAEEFYHRTVSLPIYPGLEESDLQYISNTTIKALSV
ncbi:MAG: UDP-4-amino-4,6-dideoxy-N-acetyl-beta-L-altrosamine transaminase [Ignavibacteriales bacterium]|nr:UDP-4-amino-4,6-dideoxy-N-acetyl-beta-L-altrosamine transaminase [Ignavibacteriales bacterium]